MGTTMPLTIFEKLIISKLLYASLLTIMSAFENIVGNSFKSLSTNYEINHTFTTRPDMQSKM